ncbi:S41 family peptidase [Prochlorococcus sp. MIT 1223]|uniref:S41 family peptidase n=1 Tax=Prochlorococcus sp. MIT 1223 TaxID=3096217 RepID=UPI002A75D89C|nr:S41 family peptidase [Prochlorococcus sp. MIT 1223]
MLFSLLISPSSAFQNKARSIIKSNPKEVIDEVWQIIYRDYLDSSGTYDKKEWISTRKELLGSKYIDSQDSYIAIREMLLSLKDPYTRFLDPKEFMEMRIDTSGELTGVGIQISLDTVTNKIVVVSPIEGTPAFKAGIKPQDVIFSVDGQFTDGMTIDQVVKLIRGERGSTVSLGIMRENRFFKFSLVRERIEINTVKSHINMTNEGINIGYIRLKQFNANAARDMSKSIEKLEKDNVLGYVLDLRGNPGGLLEVSIEIARQWIDQGVIVSTQTRDGIKDVRMANGSALTNKPIVILVNEGSASASEILSGAIRDNGRGILVGKKTFGKGLVQSVRALSDGSGLTVTIAKYLTPNGIDINKNGLKPDINADLIMKSNKKLSSLDLGTNKDSQYVIAENELVKKLSNQLKDSAYNPVSTNLRFALSN